MFNYKMKQIFISYHSCKYNLYSLMFIVFNLCEHFPDDINLAIHKIYNFLNVDKLNKIFRLLHFKCVENSTYFLTDNL